MEKRTSHSLNWQWTEAKFIEKYPDLARDWGEMKVIDIRTVYLVLGTVSKKMKKETVEQKIRGRIETNQTTPLSKSKECLELIWRPLKTSGKKAGFYIWWETSKKWNKYNKFYIFLPLSLSLSLNIYIYRERDRESGRERDIRRDEYFIIIIMSRWWHGYPWPSLATPPYCSSPQAGLQDNILYPNIAAECMFVLVVLLLHGQVWGSIRVHHLWVPF